MLRGCSRSSLAVALETKALQVIYYILIHICKYTYDKKSRAAHTSKDRQSDVSSKRNVKKLVLNA